MNRIKQYNSNQYSNKITDINMNRISNKTYNYNIIVPDIHNYNDFKKVLKKFDRCERKKKIEKKKIYVFYNDIDIRGEPQYQSMSKKTMHKELKNNFNYKKQIGNCDGKRDLDRKLDDVRIREARLLKQKSIDVLHLWTTDTVY
jgi:hypothetical protein